MTTAALSALGNERIRQGGNLSPFDEISLQIDELYEEARNWADGSAIENEGQHKTVSDLEAMLAEAGKRAEALRVEEVKPLDEAKAAIQAKYHPLIGDTKAGKGKVVLGRAALKDLLTAWRARIAAEKAAKAAAARAEAEEENRRALEAMRASRGDLEAREQAEEQLRHAKEAEAFAARQHKAATTGLGLRTRKVPVLRDLNLAVRHYWKQDPEAFARLVTELAEAEVRAGRAEIPGFEIITEQRAI